MMYNARLLITDPIKESPGYSPPKKNFNPHSDSEDEIILHVKYIFVSIKYSLS